MRRACIMGHPVGHSRSPMLHGYWLRTLGIDGAYEFADVAPDAFAAFLSRPCGERLCGRQHSPSRTRKPPTGLVDRREPAGRDDRCVNTVWYDGGALVGGNTDWLGITGSLDAMHPGWDASAGSAVVLRRRRLGARRDLCAAATQVFRRGRQPDACARRRARRRVRRRRIGARRGRAAAASRRRGTCSSTTPRWGWRESRRS